jgi:exodeoxyribonuclease V alpha subunit
MKVELRIVKEVYSNADYKVLAAMPTFPNDNLKYNKYGNISLVGSLSFLSVGDVAELEIDEETNPKYGISYKVVSSSFSNGGILSKEQQEKILLNITTQKQVSYIMQSEPNFVQKVLDGKEDDIDTSKIYNVKNAKKATYVREIKNKYKIYMIMSKFEVYELSYDEAKNLDKTYGTKLDDALHNKPYEALISVAGRSFQRADETILKINPELQDSFQRGEYLVLYILNQNELEGNTYIDAESLAKNCYEIAPSLVSDLKNICLKSTLIWYDNINKKCAKMTTYQDEYDIALKLEKCANTPVFSVEKCAEDNIFRTQKCDWTQYKQQDGFDLTDEQQEFLRCAAEKNVCVLIGYAGSGKTSATKALISMLDDNNLTYLLLAPTGTSARVLSKYTKRKASTIHKQLASSGDITADYVIVDEFSFVGVDIMAKLMNAISMGTKIILIGDPYQLNSISCGNVFNDIINSKTIPVVRLTKIFRYGIGGISTVVTDIRNGLPYISNSGEKIFQGAENCDDYTFEEISDNPLEQVMNAYRSLLDRYTNNDIIILSPFNVGDIGTYAINNAVQEAYNNNKDKSLSITKNKHKINFYIGDFVINTKNWYNATTLKEWNGEASEENNNVFISNGQRGIIRDVQDDCVVVDYDGDLIVYDMTEIKRLLLGYCISDHKAQGSQFPAVISVISSEHERITNRALIYVANSRAQEYLYEIGNPITIKRALDIVPADTRKTLLKDFLIKEAENEDRDRP